jgi:vancomycin resistance protein YoaR
MKRLEELLKSVKINEKWIVAIIAVFSVTFAYHVVYANRTLPGVSVGTINVGGLSRESVMEKVQERFDEIIDNGITIFIDDKKEILNPENIGIILDVGQTVENAMAVGRSGSWYTQIKDRLSAPFVHHEVSTEITISKHGLEREVALFAEITDTPRKDVRLNIEGTKVEILYNTESGRIIDQKEMRDAITEALRTFDLTPIKLELKTDAPIGDPLLASKAQRQAYSILRQPLTLAYDDNSFIISQSQIGKWIKSDYDGTQLIPVINRALLSIYITEVAEKISVAPQAPEITIEDERVIDFVPPRYGQALLEDETIDLIVDTINDRRDEKTMVTRLNLPVKITRPSAGQVSGFEGIVELIGKASTLFEGSSDNRIHNIKNGVKFLTGIVVKPGEEFSTVQSLGQIDNTTGYLPEMVIRGDRTIPEFGGGLCQVSTTLFRAVLDAGLPIIERQNHSYRVAYYETDSNGVHIGPGLDATIYKPHPDFKFKNDMNVPVLIYGYVKGTKATFELYGTRDGRFSSVTGPVTLSTTPPGDPVYIETDTLPEGTVKKIGSAHAGASTTATYTITYPDGSMNTQEFKSYYRRWPARFLVGIGE